MIHTSYSGSTYNTQEDISDASVLLNSSTQEMARGRAEQHCQSQCNHHWRDMLNHSSGTRIIYNTALSSYTSSSNPLVFVEEVLVTGHEIGHSWGSYHDPATTPSCSNVFIMNQYAQDGSQPTHKMFSNCNRTSIGAVLSAKAQNCFTDLYLYSYVGWPTFNIHLCNKNGGGHQGTLDYTMTMWKTMLKRWWSAKVQVPGSVGTTWYGPGIGPTLMNNVAWTASHPPDLYLYSYTERINPVGWPTFNIHHCKNNAQEMVSHLVVLYCSPCSASPSCHCSLLYGGPGGRATKHCTTSGFFD
eukprot:Em0267g3a